MFHHVAGTLPHTTPSSDYEVVPYWRVTAANVQVSRLPESEWLMDNYAVLNITVRVGVVVLNSLRPFFNLTHSCELLCIGPRRRYCEVLPRLNGSFEACCQQAVSNPQRRCLRQHRPPQHSVLVHHFHRRCHSALSTRWLLCACGCVCLCVPVCVCGSLYVRLWLWRVCAVSSSHPCLPTQSSAYHPGDGEWSLVSMSGRVEALGVRVAIRPYLWMDNSAGTSGLQVLVSVPMLRFGPHQLIASAAEVTSAGR